MFFGNCNRFDEEFNKNGGKWGGRRACAGRRRTCANKVPFNRRISEDVLKILKNYAKDYGITETEALESAIMLQSNIDKIKGEKKMKIAIPTIEEKLCSHFGHCESFTFVEVNPQTKEILSKETKVPEEGISCQSATWVAQQGASVVLAGGMGMRPQMMFAQNGVKVVAGCPELPITEVVNGYLTNTLDIGKNSCDGEHHHCQGHHGENSGHHHCHGHHEG